MSIFTCHICNAFFHRKAHLEQHLNKKNSCKRENMDFKKEALQTPPQNPTQFTQFSTQFTQFSTQKPQFSTICPKNLEKPIFSDDNVNVNLDNFDEIKNSSILNDDLNSNSNSSLIETNDLNNLNNANNANNANNTNNTNNITIECKYCLKNFSRKDALKRHLVGFCKVKKQYDEEKEDIFKKLLEHEQTLRMKEEQIETLMEQNKIFVNELEVLKKKINKLSKTEKTKVDKVDKIDKALLVDNIDVNISNTISNSNNITNTINTNSNTNNVVFQLVNYGKEDLNKIDTKEFVNSIVKNNRLCGVKIPEEILKLIHFNPNYPELNNIYISDINREKCMIYDDGMWKLSPDDKIPEVIDKVVKFSYDKQDMLREKFANNKPVIDRLNVIDKYTKFTDVEYLEELKVARDEENINNQEEIKRCEEFQKKTYNTFKTTLYNEGLKIKKKNK